MGLEIGNGEDKKDVKRKINTFWKEKTKLQDLAMTVQQCIVDNKQDVPVTLLDTKVAHLMMARCELLVNGFVSEASANGMVQETLELSRNVFSGKDLEFFFNRPEDQRVSPYSKIKNNYTVHQQGYLDRGILLESWVERFMATDADAFRAFVRVPQNFIQWFRCDSLYSPSQSSSQGFPAPNVEAVSGEAASKKVLEVLIDSDCALTSLGIAGGGRMATSRDPRDARLGSALLKPLLFGLGLNTSLTSLDISGNWVGPGIGAMLGAALRRNRTLTALNWDRNGITMHDLKAFRGCLYGNKKLRDVPCLDSDLDNLLQVVAAMPFNTLQQLRLSDCANADHASCRELLEALQKHSRSLTQLDLPGLGLMPVASSCHLSTFVEDPLGPYWQTTLAGLVAVQDVNLRCATDGAVAAAAAPPAVVNIDLSGTVFRGPRGLMALTQHLRGRAAAGSPVRVVRMRGCLGSLQDVLEGAAATGVTLDFSEDPQDRTVSTDQHEEVAALALSSTFPVSGLRLTAAGIGERGVIAALEASKLSPELKVDLSDFDVNAALAAGSALRFNSVFRGLRLCARLDGRPDSACEELRGKLRGLALMLRHNVALLELEVEVTLGKDATLERRNSVLASVDSVVEALAGNPGLVLPYICLAPLSSTGIRDLAR
eukprot:gene33956-43899_t